MIATFETLWGIDLPKEEVPKVSDEELFSVVAKEVSAGQIDEALLAKARFLARGDRKDTEFKYIELRVRQLKSEKNLKYVNATKGAARIIAPALGRFSWDLAKAVLVGFLVLVIVVVIGEAIW